MKAIWLVALMFSMTTVMAGEDARDANAGQQNSGPWIPVAKGERIFTMEDVPLDLLHRDPEKYKGMIFEDRFKFYHIYRNKEDMDPALSRQTIVGKTHFTASPLMQSINMIMIQITPAQDEWLRNKGIRRQDVVKARIRFAGLAPGDALAFDLLEIEGSTRSWLLRPAPADKGTSTND